MTKMVLKDPQVGPVERFDECRGDKPCAHCKAGRPAVPVEAGDPREPEALYELDDAVRWALPPAYHRPVWMDICTPAGWFCACCWDAGQVTQWPCHVATAHGGYLARAFRFELELARKHKAVLVNG